MPRFERPLRTREVTRVQAVRGRFASAFGPQRFDRARWRGSRLAARDAWRHRRHVRFVPWLGALYWPYAYTDIFYYAFWPFGYEPAFWAYVYDDFFDGIFFPYGAPYVEYAYGPYVGPYAVETTGAAPAGLPPGRVSRSTREFCRDQANAITAWPFAEIEQTVQPTADQRELLDSLKKAAGEAAVRFQETCPETVPMTPVGRLQAMIMRLQAALEAVKIVRPPLEAFYNSLSDEQRARFDEIGPQFARQPQQTAGVQPPNAQEECSGEKAGLGSLAVERIERAVEPTDQQYAALDRLNNALQKAVDVLNHACPTTMALTPTGRLDLMQKRLEAMIEAGQTVRPALADFYASLSHEQKARFNRLGRDTARSRR